MDSRNHAAKRGHLGLLWRSLRKFLRAGRLSCLSLHLHVFWWRFPMTSIGFDGQSFSLQVFGSKVSEATHEKCEVVKCAIAVVR